MPLGALALAKAAPARPTAGRGTAAVGFGGGRTVLPKLAQLAKGNVAFGVGVMVLLMVVTAAYLPLVLPLCSRELSFNPAKIARSLLLLMLLPLSRRAAVKACFADVPHV